MKTPIVLTKEKKVCAMYILCTPPTHDEDFSRNQNQSIVQLVQGMNTSHQSILLSFAIGTKLDELLFYQLWNLQLFLG